MSTPAFARMISIDVGIRHLAFVDISCAKANAYVIHRWHVVDLFESDQTVCKTRRNSIDFIADRLLNALEEHFGCPDAPPVDVVLIENQPCNKNPVMKSVQMIIYTFFHCVRRMTDAFGAIKLVSACNKLDRLRHGTAPASVPNPCEYRDRKARSIATATAYLQDVMQDRDSLELLRASKKKDDMSDCLLQAIAYAERHAMV